MGKISLVRTDFTPLSTIGKLEYDGLSLFTLEDPIRDKKIKGETAIPSGKYRVEITWSPRFGKLMPILLDVPNFTGIRIHSGNKPEDTEGCILVGLEKKKDWIGRSKEAYLKLYKKIEEGLKSGPVEIEIRKA